MKTRTKILVGAGGAAVLGYVLYRRANSVGTVSPTSGPTPTPATTTVPATPIGTPTPTPKPTSYTIRLQWAKTHPQGLSSNQLTVTTAPVLKGNATLTLYANGTSIEGMTKIVAQVSGQGKIVHTFKEPPNGHITAWATVTVQGQTVATSKKVTATWADTCPSGYQVQQSNGRTICAETPQQEKTNLKKSYQAAIGPQGISISTSNPTTGGLNAYQQAKLAQSIATSKYGGAWHVYVQNGQYVVMTPARAQKLLSEGGDNIHYTTSSGGTGGLVVQPTGNNYVSNGNTNVSPSNPDVLPVTVTNPEGINKSGKISPSKAKQLWNQSNNGGLAGPGFVVNGVWYQDFYQIPTSLRAQSRVN